MKTSYETRLSKDFQDSSFWKRTDHIVERAKYFSSGKVMSLSNDIQECEKKSPLHLWKFA